MTRADDPELAPTFRDGYPVLPVGWFVRALRDHLREIFPYLWLRGELSGVRRSRRGHLYFALKDPEGQLECVCFAREAARLPFAPEEGLAVLAGGRLEVYGERGRLQLVVDQLEPEGIGALALAFEQLKRRLAAEGLFDPARKRPIPRLPRRVGVVTSPTGAVIRDILQVSGRRHPGTPILIAPTRVQGVGAEEEIAAALTALGREAVDVIIVARGGGSLEDLAPFNTELVARAVAASPVPVVSAVGHETDTTICDLVADLRAPTPSAAAELVFPDRSTELQRLERIAGRLRAGLVARGRQAAERLQRDTLLLERMLHRHYERLRERLGRHEETLRRVLTHRYRHAHEHFEQVSLRLDTLSPLRILARGYGVVADLDGRPLTSVAHLDPGRHFTLRLHDGRILGEVRERYHEPLAASPREGGT